MLTDGLKLLDTSKAENFQIDSGTSLPATGNNVGELFYLTAGTPGLYVYSGTQWVQATGSNGSAITSTSDLPEGTNLYFTTARAAAAAPVQSVAGKTGSVSLSTTDVSEGTNQYFTSARASAAAPVQSVAGKTGAVTLTTDNLTEGTNLFFTSTRARNAVSAGSGIQFNTSTGVISATNYDLVANVVGKPTASANVMNFVVIRPFSLPQSLTNTKARAGTASTGAATFTIKKNGVSIGTIAFAAGNATTPTITFSAAVSFAVGDLLQITAPSSQDGSLADVSIALSATLS